MPIPLHNRESDFNRTRSPALGSRVLGKRGGGGDQKTQKHGDRPGSLRSTKWSKQEHRNERKILRGLKANTVGQKCLDGQRKGAVEPVLLSVEKKENLVKLTTKRGAQVQ